MGMSEHSVHSNGVDIRKQLEMIGNVMIPSLMLWAPRLRTKSSAQIHTSDSL